MTHVTCRLTAKNREQLRNPTLGNRVWATSTFLLFSQSLNINCVQHDTIRDAILTCAQKLTQVSLTDTLRSISRQSGKSVESVRKKYREKSTSNGRWKPRNAVAISSFRLKPPLSNPTSIGFRRNAIYDRVEYQLPTPTSG